MRVLKILCESCGKDLVRHELTLEKSGMVLRDYPEVYRTESKFGNSCYVGELHFCTLECLKKWCKELPE